MGRKVFRCDLLTRFREVGDHDSERRLSQFPVTALE